MDVMHFEIGRGFMIAFHFFSKIGMVMNESMR